MKRSVQKPILYLAGGMLLYFLAFSCGTFDRRKTTKQHSYSGYEKRRKNLRDYTRCFDSYIFRGLSTEEAKILCGRKVGKLYE